MKKPRAEELKLWDLILADPDPTDPDPNLKPDATQGRRRGSSKSSKFGHGQRNTKGIQCGPIRIRQGINYSTGERFILETEPLRPARER